jgi:acetyl-CoA synthetase
MDFELPIQIELYWAIDYSDDIALGNDQPALHFVDEEGDDVRRSFQQMSERSSQVVNYCPRSECGMVTGCFAHAGH